MKWLLAMILLGGTVALAQDMTNGLNNPNNAKQLMKGGLNNPTIVSSGGGGGGGCAGVIDLSKGCTLGVIP
jgi:hypothetical protein